MKKKLAIPFVAQIFLLYCWHYCITKKNQIMVNSFLQKKSNRAHFSDELLPLYPHLAPSEVVLPPIGLPIGWLRHDRPQIFFKFVVFGNFILCAETMIVWQMLLNWMYLIKTCWYWADKNIQFELFKRTYSLIVSTSRSMQLKMYHCLF